MSVAFTKKINELQVLVNELDSYSRNLINNRTYVANYYGKWEWHKAIRRMNQTIKDCRLNGFNGSTESQLEQAFKMAEAMRAEYVLIELSRSFS